MSRRLTDKGTAALALVLGVLVACGARAAANDVAALLARERESQYADGTYTARGQYGNQPSFIVVTVTLEDGVITAAEVVPQAYVPQSLTLQRRFAEAVPGVVVGKPIDQVNVGKLAGSSGTPRGFNDAIRQIRQQASQPAGQ